MKRKLLAGLCMFGLMVGTISNNTLAASNSVNGYTLTVSCSNTTSYHSIVPKAGQVYPTGTGKAYYTRAGSSKVAQTSGVSNQSYWNGTISLTSDVHIYQAQTILTGAPNNPATTYN